MKPAETHAKWKVLQQKIAEEFDSDIPDLKVILFLIGVQELGKGPGKYSKRQKGRANAHCYLSPAERNGVL